MEQKQHKQLLQHKELIAILTYQLVYSKFITLAFTSILKLLVLLVGLKASSVDFKLNMIFLN
jgi:hypothetical protein